jgi:hypothetical protein
MGRLAPKQTLWPPFCGAEYGVLDGGGVALADVARWLGEVGSRMVAGDPIVCDRQPHGTDSRHSNSELGFTWW